MPTSSFFPGWLLSFSENETHKGSRQHVHLLPANSGWTGRQRPGEKWAAMQGRSVCVASPGRGERCDCRVCRRECGCEHPISSPPPAPHVLFTCLSQSKGTFIFIASAFKYIYTPLRRHSKSPQTPARAPFTEPPRISMRLRKASKGRFGDSVTHPSSSTL